jgi:tetrapyrrole methylase family protein/MazG family protein
VTAGATQALSAAPVARLRTNVHPAAAVFELESYDEWYESANSFEELYARIVDDLVVLAHTSPNHEVVYAVPGSPVVAEHTVELLRERRDVDVVCEPAVSVIDVACAALGVDPMSRGLRILDALNSTEPFRGPGPLLILQTYAPEVLATVADRLPPDTQVDVLHHLGLDDERIVRLDARDLATFADADHLTSLYVEGLRTAGEAMDDLVSFTRRLRAECPWDQEQTHESLTRYLVEESYETLDALSNLAAMIEAGEEDATLVAHAEEELGDLLFQVLFHSELGDEEGRFNLATIADAERDKLTGRHPHVFADAVVDSADEVAERWEVLKKAEKGRTSVLDGIAWQLPALALHAKVLKRSRSLDVEVLKRSRSLDVEVPPTLEDVATLLLSYLARPQDEVTVARGLRSVLWALSSCAAGLGIDLESLLREDVLRRRDQILAIEANQ